MVSEDEVTIPHGGVYATSRRDECEFSTWSLEPHMRFARGEDNSSTVLPLWYLYQIYYASRIKPVWTCERNCVEYGKISAS